MKILEKAVPHVILCSCELFSWWFIVVICLHCSLMHRLILLLSHFDVVTSLFSRSFYFLQFYPDFVKYLFFKKCTLDLVVWHKLDNSLAICMFGGCLLYNQLFCCMSVVIVQLLWISLKYSQVYHWTAFFLLCWMKIVTEVPLYCCCIDDNYCKYIPQMGTYTFVTAWSELGCWKSVVDLRDKWCAALGNGLHKCTPWPWLTLWPWLTPWPWLTLWPWLIPWPWLTPWPQLTPCLSSHLGLGSHLGLSSHHSFNSHHSLKLTPWP